MEKFVSLSGSEEGNAALLRALAAPSQHPFSQAVAAHFAGSESAAVTGWREERGDGVAAEWDGRARFPRLD